jgi:diketogulonate reductase-like aldo/keto reductase
MTHYHSTSSKPDRLKEVLAVLDLSPALSDEEISAIEAAGKEAGHHRVFMKHLDETN